MSTRVKHKNRNKKIKVIKIKPETFQGYQSHTLDLPPDTNNFFFLFYFSLFNIFFFFSPVVFIFFTRELVFCPRKIHQIFAVWWEQTSWLEFKILTYRFQYIYTYIVRGKIEDVKKVKIKMFFFLSKSNWEYHLGFKTYWEQKFFKYFFSFFSLIVYWVVDFFFSGWDSMQHQSLRVFGDFGYTWCVAIYHHDYLFILYIFFFLSLGASLFSNNLKLMVISGMAFSRCHSDS